MPAPTLDLALSKRKVYSADRSSSPSCDPRLNSGFSLTVTCVKGHFLRVNVSSIVTRTGTGLPCRVPGLNLHCSAAAMAS